MLNSTRKILEGLYTNVFFLSMKMFILSYNEQDLDYNCHHLLI